MKSLSRLLSIALICLLSAACQKAPPPAPAAPAIVVPADANDSDAWKKYFSAKVQAWLKSKGKAGRIWATFLPKDGDPAEMLKTTQDNLDRGILAGTILAFGSPDSAKMADFIQTSFTGVREKSLAGVIVVFVGDAADKDRVQQAVAASGVEYAFIEAK